jgi:DNA-binding HxlR family transcriptional regulator
MSLEKITDKLEAARRRSYDDACAAAHALDLLGERWALLVVRELMLGPKRFSDLRTALPGISANVLTQRLEGLEEIGVLVRRELPPPSASRVYELTEWGYEAEPIFQALGRWAARSPHHDTSLPFSTSSLIMSLRTMFSVEKSAGFKARIALRIGAEAYVAEFANGAFTIERAEPKGPDAILEGDARSIAGVIYGGIPLEALEAAGALKASGDRAKLTRFLTLFPLPPKAPLRAQAR